MVLKFENIDNVKESDFRYIRRKTKYFLMYVLEDVDYSKFLTKVDVLNNSNEELDFCLLKGAGGYNYSDKKIILTNIKNKKELDLCIHHEVLHVKFTINNQLEFNNYDEIVGYNFLNEFNSVYYSYMYNLILDPNDEYTIKAVRGEFLRYPEIYNSLKEGCEKIKDIIKDVKLDGEIQQKVAECESKIFNTNNYLLARSIASIYIVLKMTNKSNMGNEVIDNIIKYIKENIDLKNITLNNCEDIGKMLLG